MALDMPSYSPFYARDRAAGAACVFEYPLAAIQNPLQHPQQLQRDVSNTRVQSAQFTIAARYIQ